MKGKIEVLPGKFIKYEVSQELVDELSKIDVDAGGEIRASCEHFAYVYRDELKRIK